ncbi:MAG: hypothetical protein EOL92_00565 [Bacteroidia bacterium]|nr:hypothetical protein [Bacteroidia bacterium]
MTNLVALKKAVNEAQSAFVSAVWAESKVNLPYTWGVVGDFLSAPQKFLCPKWQAEAKRLCEPIEDFQAQIDLHLKKPTADWSETSWGLGDGESLQSALARAIVHGGYYHHSEREK